MSKRKPTANHLWMEIEINSQRLAHKQWQGKLEILLFSNQLVHGAAGKEIVLFFVFFTSKAHSLVILPKKIFLTNFKINLYDFC